MVTKQDQGGISPQVTTAQERATKVVLAYRAIDWESVKLGDPAAVRGLVNACELHDATRRFLAEEDVGAVGAKLDKGLDRFYAQEVGPRLADPLVVLQLSQLPVAEATPAPGSPAATTEEGLAPRSRPQVTVGHTVRMNTGCGHLYVTVNESEDGKPFELFNHMGKAGGCAASQNEAIGRLISYALRCGASIEPLIKQLKGISCHRPAWGEGGKISSCSDAIGKALETYYQGRQLREEKGLLGGTPEAHLATPTGNGNGNSNGSAPAPAPVATAPSATTPIETPSGISFDRAALSAPRAEVTEAAAPSPKGSLDVHRVQGACVDCGSQLSFEEGCVKCHSCGFTECG